MRQKLLFVFVALLMLTENSNAKKVAFIDQSTYFAINSQSGITDALTAAGYQVTTIDLNNYAATTPVGGVDFAALGAYDLIVISKACNSGMFSDPAVVAGWAALKKPYIALTPYIIRSNRLNLINSAGYTVSPDKTDLTSITHAVPVVDDPVLAGVTTDLVPFNYFTGYYETITTTATTMDGNTGTVIVNLNSDAVKGAGMPLVIRWAAGSTYTTSTPSTTGVTAGVTNAAPRTYIGIGSDNVPSAQNYNNFTAQSLKLFMNEVQSYAPLTSGVNTVRDESSKLVSAKGKTLELLTAAYSIEIYNSIGALVFIQKNVSVGSTISLNVAGVYLVKAKMAQGVGIQKIILQ
jgi:hypothetical protein